MKHLSFTGTLSTYYETGMEHLGLVLEVDSPQFKIPNPKFGQANEIEFFRTLDGTVFLRPNDRLEVDTDSGIQVFMIGNRNLAKEDGYKFGSVYPKEISSISDLKNFIKHFNSESKAKVIRPIKNAAFYGGTFDPIHIGHKEIIKQLHYQFDVVFVLPSNNWTKKDFVFSLDERLKAVQAVANNFLNVEVLNWSLNEDTGSTLSMFNKIKSLIGFEPKIVIGSDNLKNIHNWKNFEELKNLPFVVFQRQDLPKDIKITNYQIINFNKNCSSTEIRNNNLINLIPLEAQEFLSLEKISKKIDF